ncbi:MAG: hypothetical protein LBE92_20675 [Chryseobacterium sp.]|jgi:hypothetical protein|uniref:hypothetical protein n=1 Tax=Chryseobacterium sp. TaxID=1871047 RepID=UPI002829E82D|nr:hypothetical protein [Chryseobacterium sp.]MDR2238551.1 hypothetical protein [Chryseobacterium sp.]
MKKNTTDFEARCWADHKKRLAFRQMERFFQFNDLIVSKERLHSIMSCAVQRNRRLDEDPLMVFQFHQAVRSFVRAGYHMMLKEKKHAVGVPPGKVSAWVLGLLSEEEYRNPLLVFKKAFREYNIREFDYFMSGIVYFSLGVYEHLPERNIINPYIHLIKMLDAAHLILERRGKSIKKTHKKISGKQKTS